MKIFDAYGYTFGVPDWVRWVAVDRDNTLYGYYEEPYIDVGSPVVKSLKCNHTYFEYAGPTGVP